MRVGFDIGGTFTDVVLAGDDGRLITAKMLSLLDRVGDDIGRMIRERTPGVGVQGFVHGTTVASNAVIEGKLARTGLITTVGFRDELEMRGQRRPDIYDIEWDRIPPLIPRSLRLEVEGRILGDGSIDRPLDEAGVEAAVRRLVAGGVEAICVCLVNSYLNPVHERAVGAVIERIAPSLVYCLSCDVHPEIREYDRASTTAINAGLIPVFDRYMDRLEGALSPFSQRFLMMQSNGGIMTAAAARKMPAHLIESGPAAGVLAAARLAREIGLDRALSFDMGGTTAKACLIEGGVPLEKAGGEVGGATTQTSRLFGGGGHALRVPWLDIVEVGAGGGSMAWIDDGGALRVGPESAGADPGPVCYRHGGTRPTVTDANVVLGYINPQSIADSTLSLDREAAWSAIESALAKPLGLSVHEAAHGVVRVANATMMRALRAVSTERGRDPRQFTLISFGGSGSLHAPALAESLGIRRVIVPVHPGLFSALGLLLADYRHDYVQSVPVALKSADPQAILGRFAVMELRALADLKEDGVTGEVVLERRIDLKYDYQMGEMTLPFPDDVAPADLGEDLARRFGEAHLQAFGHDSTDPIELVNLRLRATAAAGTLSFASLAGQVAAPDGPPPADREAYFGREHGLLTARVRRRADITAEEHGPLIVQEPDTTIVVPPGWSVARDDWGSLVLTHND